MRHLPVPFARRTSLLALLLCLAPCALTGCATINAAQKTGQIGATFEEADRQFTLGHDKEALTWCDRALAVLPHSPVPYVGDTSPDDPPDVPTLPMVLVSHGRYPELVAYLTKAVADPKLADNWQILQELAQAQTELDQVSDARATYSKMLAAVIKAKKTPGATISPAVLRAQAEAEWNSGDQAQAQKDYQTIITTGKGEDADKARNELAYEMALAKVDLPQALALAQKAVADLRDGDDDIDLGLDLDTLGWIEHQMGRDSDAIFHVQEAISLVPGIADEHYHLAEIYRALKQPDEAVIEYRQALALDPSSKDAQTGLAAVKTPS